MTNVGYGKIARDRAWHLVATLMNRGEKEGVKLNCSSADKYSLTVKATLREIAGWAKELPLKPELEIEDVRQSLTKHLGNTFLQIMIDERERKAGRGAEQWEFELQLWSTNLDINKDKFYEQWEKVSQLKKSTKSSQGLNSSNISTSHQQETEDQVNVIFISSKENENEVEKIQKQLEKEGLKVKRPSKDNRAGVHLTKWGNQIIKQNNPVSVAVLVGKNESNLWKDDKIISLLNTFHTKKCFLIPVLLSDASSNAFEEQDVPHYLKNFTGDATVDFTQGNFPESISKFIHAVRGELPSIRQQLETVFSCKGRNEKAGNSSNPIEIVLPAYPLLYSKEKEVGKSGLEEQPEIKRKKEKALENQRRSETLTSNFNDVVAYLSLDSLFQKNYLPTPLEPMKDEQINLNDQKEQTYILIGLSSSQFDVVDDLSQKYVEEKFFEIIAGNKGKDGFYPFQFKCSHYDISKQRIVPIEDCSDLYTEKNLALFAKFKIGSKRIIVCGGNTEKATRKLAWYIEHYWDEVYRNLKDEKGSELEFNDSFAVAIETPNDEQSLTADNFKFVQKCIKR